MSNRLARAVRRRVSLLAGVACLLLADLAWSETAAVQYVSETTVYVDAGAAAGLLKESEVRVLRDGQVVAVLTVEYVAQHSASCRIVSGGSVRVGDRVEFEADASPSSHKASSRVGPSASPRRRSESVWSRLGQVRGRIATFYTRSTEQDGTYQNPAATALLRWIGAGQEDFSIRVRGDRPSFDYYDDQAFLVRDAAEIRLFEARARYRSRGAALTLEAGRFLPAEFEGIGPVDGGSIAWRPTPTVRFGATGGRSVTNGLRGFASRHGHAFGGFVGTHRADGRNRWSALASWTTLQDRDLTRRQFSVLRSDATIGAVRFYQRIEVDLNPQWKRDLGEKDVELTAWSIGNELRFQRRTSLTLSIDSRRPVLLPEMRDSIDNLHLQRWYGARGALRVGLGRFQVLRAGTRYGWRAGDGATTSSWDVGLASSKLLRKGLSGSVRVNSHHGDTGSNAHLSATLRLRASTRVGLAAAGGVGRQETEAVFVTTVQTKKEFAWVRLGADLRASNGLWFDVSSEWQDRNRGHELTLAVGRVF